MVVADSSALIPLIKAGRLDILINCFKNNITIPAEVWEEVVVEGRKIGKAIGDIEEIKHEFNILSVAQSDLLKIDGLEENDLKILSVAHKQKDILLTNDAELHDAAVAQKIRVWWLTALVFDSVKKNILSAQEGKTILLELISAGAYLRSEILAQALLLIDQIKKN